MAASERRRAVLLSRAKHRQKERVEDPSVSHTSNADRQSSRATTKEIAEAVASENQTVDVRSTLRAAFDAPVETDNADYAQEQKLKRDKFEKEYLKQYLTDKNASQPWYATNVAKIDDDDVAASTTGAQMMKDIRVPRECPM